jgi:MFS family permease
VAVFWRVVSGVLNGNVGVMRTMISEIVREKKYQSRAFVMLPMCFNIGSIIGPILGGLLADPVKTYPNIFGPGSVFGGDTGVWWMQKWPYALPNFISAVFLIFATLIVLFGLEEVRLKLEIKHTDNIRRLKLVEINRIGVLRYESLYLGSFNDCFQNHDMLISLWQVMIRIRP